MTWNHLQIQSNPTVLTSFFQKKRGMKRDGESENLLVNMCCAFYKKSDCKLCITRKTMGICSQTYIDIDENKNKNEIK